MSQQEHQQNIIQRSKVLYRLELEKKIEINHAYAQRKNRAVIMRIISYALFGMKRYQNIYLTCSLNYFYYALLIANAAHQRVSQLAMIIKFQTVDVLQYYSQPNKQGKTYADIKYSRIVIKLTKNPTEEDKLQPGYQPGLKEQQVKNPLKQIIGDRRRPKEQQRSSYKNNNTKNYKQQNKRYRNRDGRKYNKNQQNQDKKYQQRQVNYKKNYRQEKYQENQQKYPRGQRKTRGQYRQKQSNFRRQQKSSYNKEGQQRGDRRPKNRGRYDDD